MSQARRHHFVPRFVLNGFAREDGRVCVYEKGRPGPRWVGTRDAGVSRDFYTVDTMERERNHQIIEDLMAKVDGLGSNGLRKLLQQEPLGAQERADFAYFLAMAYLRVPAFRDFNQHMMEGFYKHSFAGVAQDDEWFTDLTRWMELNQGEQMPDDVREDIRRMYLDQSYSLTFHPEDHLRLLPLAADWSLSIQRMGWELLEAPKRRAFVTSDNPLVMVNCKVPNRVGALRNPDVSVSYALSRRILLVATWAGSAVARRRAKDSEVSQFNRWAVRAASRFVYASYESRPLDRLVQDHIGTAPRLKFSTFRKAGTGSKEVLVHNRVVFGEPQRASI